jgi:hypothetical protein
VEPRAGSVSGFTTTVAASARASIGGPPPAPSPDAGHAAAASANVSDGINRIERDFTYLASLDDPGDARGSRINNSEVRAYLHETGPVMSSPRLYVSA